MQIISEILMESWHILLDSSIYILFGIVIAGLLKTVLSTEQVSRHLGEDNYKSVFKAALLGVPLPLCSCGVLPAAAALKRQGANKGATTAFLITTPESGIDSISITYALLDPIMTIIRPVAAFVSGVSAGLLENWLDKDDQTMQLNVISQTEASRQKQSFTARLAASLRYAFTDVWADIVVWFAAGLLLAGTITALVPDEFLARWMGGGFISMLIMLIMCIPLYICATASTPIAAALIMKGVSPGAALVLLLVGPATNITSLTVLYGILGRKSTYRYLLVLSLVAVFFGLGMDFAYDLLNIKPRAIIGEAGELVPFWLKLSGAAAIITLSIKPLYRVIRNKIMPPPANLQTVIKPIESSCTSACGCSENS
ncbi:MAG: hypothetical protein CSB24_05760 [Deltaproteobacteria bacterium]|nr:MAG: hypothetical protein CSB24_05760 [Deltaproteobacteria bacterium]